MSNQNKKYYKVRITGKEWQLIDFIRNKFKFGRFEVICHAGEPTKVKIKEPEIIFDGNIKLLLDNTIR